MCGRCMYIYILVIFIIILGDGVGLLFVVVATHVQSMFMCNENTMTRKTKKQVQN